jgi:hypothetical protein
MRNNHLKYQAASYVYRCMKWVKENGCLLAPTTSSGKSKD